MPRHRAPASLVTGAWGLVACALLGACDGCSRSKLLPRADAAAVVLVSPDAGAEPGVTVIAEVEPNGTLATAQKIDLVSPSALAVRGGFTAAGEPAGAARGRDVDVYKLVVAPEGGGQPGVDAGRPDAAAARLSSRRRLSALVHPELGLAVVVEALDDAGQVLASATGGQPGEDEGIPSLTVTPGTYYLRVRPGQVAGQTTSDAGYRLTLRLGPSEAGEEVEPNGKATMATELAASGEAVGFFGWRKDQDWYRVPLDGLPEGSVLSADLEAVPGVTASLLVLDSVERKLTEAHGRKEERVAVRNIRLPPGEPHLFLLVRADAGHNIEVRYNLRVRTEVARSGGAGGGDLEPNDDAQHASPLADGTVQGFLGRGDVDVYRYTAAEPLELDIEAAPPERVDLKMEIIREPDGLLLVRADSGKRQEPERLPNLAAPAGSLLIRLSAGKSDGNNDEPYRLTVASRRAEPGAEREPNGTAASATPIPPGASGNGLLYPRGDVDFWQAPATADGEGNVAVTATGIAGLVLELRVLSLTGRELGRFKISGDTPVTNRLAVAAEPCCQLQVREATGKAANFRDRYTVTVGK